MHVKDGRLKAYQDGELAPSELGQVQAHLEICSACRQKAEALQDRAQETRSLMDRLEPDRPPITPGLARARLTERLNQIDKERETMFEKVSSRRMRPVWAILTVIILFAAALTVPSVRAAANSFLGLFRVEQVSVIEIDASQLESALASSQQFERLMSEDVSITGGGDFVEAASVAEVVDMTGRPVRMPAALGAPQKLVVQPGGVASFDVDLKLVRALLQEVGREDVSLPADLDGKTVSIQVQDAVGAQYGSCPVEEIHPDSREEMRAAAKKYADCVNVLQMPSPEVEAPEGLDVAALGQAYLQVLGMSEEEAARFSDSVDWTTTLIVPVPEGKANIETVSVDGVQGTFLQSTNGPNPRLYVLVWAKGGMLYSVEGRGDQADALQIANSLQ